MKLMTLATIAATATALMLTPALAKSKKHHRMHHHDYSQMQSGWNNGDGWNGGWNSRNVSDPSYVSPNYRRNQALGRCVEDLGYGRFEYCGW
jgi:ribosomal protein L32E